MERKAHKVSEGDHQVRLMRWAAKQGTTIAELQLLYHIPNGGARDAATAARLRVEGVKAGVPDLHLPVARRGYHGLYVELKADGGKTSGGQDIWLARLRAEGYQALVCYGAQAAYEAIVTYLGLRVDTRLLSLDREPLQGT
jgi:hypothetical protein